MLSVMIMDNWEEVADFLNMTKEELTQQGVPAGVPQTVWVIPIHTPKRAKELTKAMDDGRHPLGQYVFGTHYIARSKGNMTYVLIA